jgi:hypothetical protein
MRFFARLCHWRPSRPPRPPNSFLPEWKFLLSYSCLDGANKTRATDNLVSTWEGLHCGLVALTDDTLEQKDAKKV